MSASTEKRNRKAAREAGTDKKTLAAAEEAKKQAKSKLRWTLGTIGVVVLIAAVLFLNSSVLYTSTTAVTIGQEKYTPAQVSYYFANQYYSFANQYGSYASMFGLDTSGGIAGLDSQSCPMLDEGTWRDYFLDLAKQSMIQSQALLDYAEQQGIEITQEETDQIDSSLADTDDYAKQLGYSGAKAFFSSNYGTGVTPQLVRELSVNDARASAAYNSRMDSLEYTDEELEEYYQGLNGASDVFDYAYYYVAAETVDSEGEDGETSSQVTDETRAAAKATAEDIMADYKAAAAEAGAGADYVALLDEAVAAHVDGESSTHQTSASGSSLGANSDFLMGSRKAGDGDVVENATASGYYAVIFISRDDNHYPMAQVRHILIMAKASDDGTYTDEAKEAAKARAEEILAEWKAGEATEESFAALAEQYSEDTGSNTNGGLYDSVYKGQMVPEFDAFCFGGHKSGDTGIVYGESTSYAGYHVMYYVGEGQQYSDYIAENALVSEDMSSWLEQISSVYEAKDGFGLRFVA